MNEKTSRIAKTPSDKFSPRQSKRWVDNRPPMAAPLSKRAEMSHAAAKWAPMSKARRQTRAVPSH